MLKYDTAQEEREIQRRLELIKALEFELAGVVEFQGGEFRGFAMAYDEHSARLIYKADFEGKRMVSFVYSDTMMNSILKAVRLGKHGKLKWKVDAYAPKES